MKNDASTMLYLAHTARPAKRGGKHLDTFEDALTEYFGALATSGQIVISGCLTVHEGADFVTYFLSPSLESLAPIHNSRFVTSAEEELFGLSAQDPVIRVVGPSADHDPFCVCSKPTGYVLETDTYATDSPVACMKCGNCVPLLRLPAYDANGEYYDVLMWQRAYSAADRLWYQGVIEASVYRQMAHPRSALAKRGRRVCSNFETSTGLPFYYRLFLFDTPYPKQCPLCDRRVGTFTRSKTPYRWKCDSCRLVIK